MLLLRKQAVWLWLVLLIISAALFVAYALGRLAVGRGQLFLPLDDVYIHFQYARQLALGQPYVYNPGLPASSGATSFLYPYILAMGYWLGFQGLNLAWWAMLVGAAALVAAMGLLYRIVRRWGMPFSFALLWAAAFGLNGAVNWHFFSGMETGLMVVAVFGVIDGMAHESRRNVTAFAMFAALLRPEGAILTIGAVGWLLWTYFTVTDAPLGVPTSNPVSVGEGLTPPADIGRGKPAPLQPLNLASFPLANGNESRRHLLSPLSLWRGVGGEVLLCLLAIALQPTVNLLLTGSAVASGNAAKSLFGIIPFDWGVVLGRVWGNFVHMWVEFISGISPREGMYWLPLLALAALLGLLMLLCRRDTRTLSLVIGLWLLAGSAAVATLDTAFWHFKRYQMPLAAVFFVMLISVLRTSQSTQEPHPLAPSPRGEGEAELGGANAPLQPSAATRRGAGGEVLRLLGVLAVTLSGLYTTFTFTAHDRLNIGYVHDQLYAMATWLQDNTPADATVAVHDVGLIRYAGGRTTVDFVGLTTAGAADYWRNGPGSVAEYLLRQQPDYIAAYGVGHGLGLDYLAATALYADPLATFTVMLDPQANVALAAASQGIYHPDWTHINQGAAILQAGLSAYDSDQRLVLDVADIASERAFNYQWRNIGTMIGFPTEAYSFDYTACGVADCSVTDGGRRINGEERFTLPLQADGRDGLLITRLHPNGRGTFDVYANGQFVARRWIPDRPGVWLEIPTRLPAALLTAQTVIRIVPSVDGGYYQPYQHLFVPLSADAAPAPSTALTTWQDGALQLIEATPQLQGDTLRVALKWYSGDEISGDYRLFVHLYADSTQPPPAQADSYPLGGTLPPGDWLAGWHSEQVRLDVSALPSGVYHLALGLYDPYSGARLEPTGGDGAGRYFLADIRK